MKKIFKDENIELYKLVLGPMGNNIYIIQSDGLSAIVDPAWDTDSILNACTNSKISKLLFTHYHYDHMLSGAAIKNKTSAKTYASIFDAPYLENTKIAPLYVESKNIKIDEKVKDKDIIKIGKSFWKVIETPGHTDGSVCYYYENNNKYPVLISGDTLFYMSCGRTDLPGGNTQKMKNSLSKLSLLPDNTLVLTGHDQHTTIKNERNFMLK